MFRILLITLSVILASCATPAQVRRENAERFNAISLSSVEKCITVKDDRMSNIITLSSYSCYQDEWGILRMVWNDYFIRAHKGRNSGITSYQVYARIVSKDWAYPYAASYLKPVSGGKRELVTVDGNVINSDVSCTVNDCTHREHFVFPLDGAYLELLHDQYKTLSARNIAERMRIFTRSADDRDFVFNINELVGMYRKAEAY